MHTSLGALALGARAMRRAWLPFAAVLGAASLVAACSSDPTYLPRDRLLDPGSCGGCHPDHYREWSRSMHAYAGDDPVFRAMNARGQRETRGALGTFCVNCHAPMAVRTGATKDGLDLDALGPGMKGVTCYFCHSVERIEGAHNGTGLVLATDGILRGGIADPVANDAHRAGYSPLHDRERLESSSLCGSCHDITTPKGANLERTYQEWQGTIYAAPSVSLACGKCHMEGRDGVAANAPGVKLRTVHSHAVPAVDVPLEPGGATDTLMAEVQRALDATLQAEVCVSVEPYNRLFVVLDNVGAGHLWPSGATQDRRAWVEVVAKKGGRTIFSSGALDPSKPVEAAADPELWLIRDCLFDQDGREVHMFWEAAESTSNQLTAPVTTNALDPRYYQTHVPREYATTATTGPGLPEQPDSVSVRVRLQPIARAVLEELVASGDLDPSYLDRIPTFDLGGTKLEWTRAAAFPSQTTDGERLLCVSTGLTAPIDTAALAKSHARCARE